MNSFDFRYAGKLNSFFVISNEPRQMNFLKKSENPFFYFFSLKIEENTFGS